LSKSSSNKSKKKTLKQTYKDKLTFKLLSTFLLKLFCVLVIIFCLIVITLPHSRNYLLKICINKMIHDVYKGIHFKNVFINFWDLSLNINGLTLANLPPYPEEFAIQINHIQIKPYISYPFKIKYNFYFNDLAFNLYYLPEKGTNIGNVYNLIKTKINEKNLYLFHNVLSVTVNKAVINITQNLEPEQYIVNKTNSFQFNNSTNLTIDNPLYLLEPVLTFYIIENNDIPTDFRQSLINEIKQNKI